ncbi:hypothetical protein IJG22_03080 [Candidatus Saccharibacteria bacterium]|nr:hypothetical protein [Candidatus Saccharibacteria bacterium]
MKKIFSIIVLLVVIMMPMTALAKNPYKDVNAKTVDAKGIESIAYIKKHSGWKAIVKNGKLNPNRIMTRREFLIVLHNLYGSAVTVTVADLKAANKKLTSAYACNRMVDLSKVLKYPIKWTGTKDKLTRAGAARYIHVFATFNAALAPKK